VAVHLDVPGDREVRAVVRQVDERRVEVLVGVHGHVAAAAVDGGDVRVVARLLGVAVVRAPMAVAARERGSGAERQGEHGDQEVASNLGNFESFREFASCPSSA
jgi:hypothetical protein